MLVCHAPCRSILSAVPNGPVLHCSVHAVQQRPCGGRLGAAKALAGCAAELGRPGMEAVAGEVALEALRAAVLGLRLADRDAPGTGTQEALADALKARRLPQCRVRFRGYAQLMLTRAVSARLPLHARTLLAGLQVVLVPGSENRTTAWWPHSPSAPPPCEVSATYRALGNCSSQGGACAQGLVRTLIKHRRIAADLARPRAAGERARAGLPDLPALLDWLWRHTAVPERRARVWVQWLHARLARLALEQAAAAAAAQARGHWRLCLRSRLHSRLPPKAVRVQGRTYLYNWRGSVLAVTVMRRQHHLDRLMLMPTSAAALWRTGDVGESCMIHTAHSSGHSCCLS